MRRINRCLNKQLIDLCQRSLVIDNLNNQLKDYLPKTLINHCTIASFNRGCLLIVTNNIWATELRYCLPQLRDNLRSKAGLYQLSSIKIQIVPDITSPLLAKLTTQDLTPNSPNKINKVHSPLKELLLALVDEKK